MSIADLIEKCPCCGSDVDLVNIDDPESQHWGGKYIECQNLSCRLTSVIAFGEDADLLLATRWNRRPPKTGLSQDEIIKLWEDSLLNTNNYVMKFARAIEKAHGIA